MIHAYKTVNSKKTLDIKKASVAVKLFNNVTLIHDDIINEDEKKNSN